MENKLESKFGKLLDEINVNFFNESIADGDMSNLTETETSYINKAGVYDNLLSNFQELSGSAKNTYTAEIQMGKDLLTLLKITKGSTGAKNLAASLQNIALYLNGIKPQK